VAVVKRVTERREADGREDLDACAEGDECDFLRLLSSKGYARQHCPFAHAVVPRRRLAVPRERGVGC